MNEGLELMSSPGRDISGSHFLLLIFVDKDVQPRVFSYSGVGRKTYIFDIQGVDNSGRRNLPDQSSRYSKKNIEQPAEMTVPQSYTSQNFEHLPKSRRWFCIVHQSSRSTHHTSSDYVVRHTPKYMRHVDSLTGRQVPHRDDQLCDAELDMRLHAQCCGCGEEFRRCSAAKTVQVCIRGSECRLRNANEVVVRRILIELWGRCIDTVEELWVFDVEFPGVDSNYRPCGRLLADGYEILNEYILTVVPMHLVNMIGVLS